jgi:predicted homoserine dehydrogenase-like protein
MAGNIKGFLDRYSNPTKIIPEADKRNLDYKMATAYTDGTKLNIEMSIIANAFGMETKVPGMFGPAAKDVHEALTLFDLPELYEPGKPFVDYVLGAEPGGGVYVIGYHKNPYQQSMLEYYKMGKGPFYLFYRPYHLCHIEAMRTIAEAVLYKKALMPPLYGFKTNVMTYAKKALSKGEKIDGIGGYCCYGQIENYDNNNKAIPICLADDLVLNKDIGINERITFEDIETSSNKNQFELYNKALTVL